MGTATIREEDVKMENLSDFLGILAIYGGASIIWILLNSIQVPKDWI